ncbi:pentatricopeptide repeat-containing protein mitochondrial-like [Dorcoceras hygrometricum]|uniref:Pentatricopeptide repeat-containing protein mitochondrial-like n=1 Tax=Dorcoceras hygrometricum TaxID=472368 RepID=A0A2Z7C225_9LAMI|nr:pentatricopeptide repeat-containing protein mitochondrial-like [Dorcoceras hygrometricum]
MVNSDLGGSTVNSDLGQSTVNSNLRQSTVNSDLRQSTVNSDLGRSTVRQSTQLVNSQLSWSTVNSALDWSTQLWTVNADLVKKTQPTNFSKLLYVYISDFNWKANNRTQNSELRTGSYNLNQLCPTSQAQPTALNKAQSRNYHLPNELPERQKQICAYANRLHRAASFAIFFQLIPSLRKRYEKNHLNKRSLALPPSCLPPEIEEEKLR